MGVAVSLPLLDAMVPALTPLAHAQARPRTRFGAIYVPNGAIMEQWIPEAVGAGFEFTPILKPLEPFKESVVVVTNLTRSHPGSQVGDHAVSAAGFLTGVWPKRTEAEDVLANTIHRPGGGPRDRSGHAVSVARSGHRRLHRLRRRLFPRLQLRLPEHRVLEHARRRRCRWTSTRAWSSSACSARPAARRSGPRASRDERSMLDSVTAEARQLQQGLGARDRQRVSEYLDNLREIERRIQRTEARNRTDVTLETPIGVPDSFEEHATLMYDLMAVAYQADVTRVFTFMLSRELSQRTYPHIGVTEQHHTVSHHGNDPQKIAQNVKVNTYHMGLFAKFIATLKALPDGDGSVLDHSLIIYGGGMGNPNGHASDPLPVVAVGGGVGKGHRHLQLKTRTPVGQPVAGRREPLRQPHRDLRRQRRSGGRLLCLIAGGVPYDGWRRLTALAVAASVLAQGADGVSKLSQAIQDGDRAAVRALLARPAEVRAVDADGTTPLHWAVRADDVATAGALLKAGVKANVANRYGDDARCRLPP